MTKTSIGSNTFAVNLYSKNTPNKHSNSRNTQCACGSGKKYKHCCLPQPEPTEFHCQCGSGKPYRDCCQPFRIYNMPNDLLTYQSDIIVTSQRNAVLLATATGQMVISVNPTTFATVVDKENKEKPKVNFKDKLNELLIYLKAIPEQVLYAVNHTEGDILSARNTGLRWTAPNRPNKKWCDLAPNKLSNTRKQLNTDIQAGSTPTNKNNFIGACLPAYPKSPRASTVRTGRLLPMDTSAFANNQPEFKLTDEMSLLPPVLKNYFDAEKKLLQLLPWKKIATLANLSLVMESVRREKKEKLENGKSIEIPWTDTIAAVRMPIKDVYGKDCGAERIYTRGELHSRWPEKWKPRDNKKLEKGSTSSKGFGLIGLKHDNLKNYQGRFWLAGGLPDAMSIWIARHEPVVVVIGENNAPKISQQIINAHPHLKNNLVVALDNDLAGTSASQWCNLPWLIPEKSENSSIKDWNDILTKIGMHELKLQLQQPPRPPLPDFELKDLQLDADKITAARNKSGYNNWIKAFRKETHPKQCAAFGLAIVHRFCGMVPEEISEERFIENLQNPNVHPCTLQNLKGRLNWINEKNIKTINKYNGFNKKIKETKNENTTYHHLDPKLPLKQQVELTHQNLHMIRAPHACGKTQVIKDMMLGLQGGGDNVMSICHLRSLTYEQSTLFQIAHYLHFSLEDDISKITGLTTCVPSLITGQVQKFIANNKNLKLLVLDEFTKILNILTSQKICRYGSTLLHILLDLIEQVINNGGTVICADADLSSFHYKKLRGWFPDIPITIWDREFTDENRNIYMKSGKFAHDLVNSKLIHDLRTHQPGECRIIMTDTCTCCKRIEHQLNQEFTNLNILAIHGKNNNNSKQREFTSEPDNAIKKHLYDVIICSPAIESGISILTPVNTVYGFYHNVLNASQCMQQLMRARTAKIFLVATDIIPPHGHIIDMIHYISGWQQSLSQDEYVSEFSGFVAEMLARNNKILQMGGKALWHFCNIRKWHTHKMEEIIDFGIHELERVQEISKAASKECKAINHKRILDALILDPTSYEEYQKKIDPLESDHNAIERYQICDQLGIIPDQLTEEDIKFWEQKFKYLRSYMNASIEQNYQPEEDPEGCEAAFRRSEQQKQPMYQYILEPIRPAGVLLDEWSEKEANDVLARCQNIQNERPFMLFTLGILPASMIKGQNVIWYKSSARFLNEILRKLGLETKRVQHQRKSYYQVKETNLNQMVKYARQRAEHKGIAMTHIVPKFNTNSAMCVTLVPYNVWLRSHCGTRYKRLPKGMNPDTVNFFAARAKIQGSSKISKPPPGPTEIISLAV